MRGFVIVIGIIIAALTLLVATGWYWWHVNGAAVVTSARAALDDGRRRGAAVDEAACLAEVLKRDQPDRDGGMREVVSRSIWFEGCLAASQLAASFCEGVPPPHEFLNTSNWISAACARQGLSDPGCQALYQQVAKYCASPARAAKLVRP